MAKALLCVDLQYDFLPGGSLAVTDGHLIIPVRDRLVHYAMPVLLQPSRNLVDRPLSDIPRLSRVLVIPVRY